ncbi:hypothetical protein Tco_0763408 [Tanacetum coccineum]
MLPNALFDAADLFVAAINGVWRWWSVGDVDPYNKLQVRFLSHCFCPPAILDEVDPLSPKHRKRFATSPGVVVLSGRPTVGNSGEGTSVVQNDDKRLRDYLILNRYGG